MQSFELFSENIRNMICKCNIGESSFFFSPCRNQSRCEQSQKTTGCYTEKICGLGAELLCCMEAGQRRALAGREPVKVMRQEIIRKRPKKTWGKQQKGDGERGKEKMCSSVLLTNSRIKLVTCLWNRTRPGPLLWLPTPLERKERNIKLSKHKNITPHMLKNVSREMKREHNVERSHRAQHRQTQRSSLMLIPTKLPQSWMTWWWDFYLVIAQQSQ